MIPLEWDRSINEKTEDAIRAAVADERESCAKLADAIADELYEEALLVQANTAEEIAVRIRARGKP